MLKNLFTKLTLIGLTSLSIFSTSVQAQTLTSKSNPKEVAIEYLSAIQSKDIDKSIELSKDVFISDNNERKDDLETFLSNPNNTLKNFEVLESLKKENDFEIFNTKLEYLNGQIVELPLKVQTSTENPKVILDDSISLSDINEIKAGKEIPVRTPRVQVAKWDVRVGQYDPYGFSSRFSCNTSYVELNYRQTCTTVFRVVEKWAVGYTNISYASQRGPNWNSGPDQVVLNLIPGKKFKDVRLLTTYVTGGRSFGEVYAY